MRRVFWVVVLAASAAGLVVGCGGGGGPSATVSGEVLVDGKPLEDGNITFTGPSGKINAGPISNGRYEGVKAEPGLNKVSLSERRPGPKKAPYPGSKVMHPTIEEGLPEKYNEKSDLTLDVQPGANTKDWKVEGKPRRK
jgi:hypothetical protein